ncbi:ATP-binding cassette domain-containing protein [Paracoccus aerius]
MPDQTGQDLVRNLSLDLRAGEIVCIYGLMGAGRTELLETCAGRLRASGGEIVLEGQEISHLPIGERIARGLALVPEDRQRDGLVQTMSVGQNLSLASIRNFTRGLFTSSRAERTLVDDSIRSVTVKTSGGARPSDRCRGATSRRS